MSAADRLLSRLDGVRRDGNKHWAARCPAHDDHHPSLSISELDDGRLLVHCFAECETRDVLAAVGLTFLDLFPAPLGSSLPRERHPFPALDALRCISTEALRVAIAAADIAAGRSLSEPDATRVWVAAHRITDALGTVGGGR